MDVTAVVDFVVVGNSWSNSQMNDSFSLHFVASF